MTVPRTWDTWLDPELANAVATQEPLRFKALVQAIQADVELASKDTNPDAWHKRVLRWIPILNNFLDVKNYNLEAEDLQLLCTCLMQAVLSTSHDLEVQVRCANSLVSVVHQRKKDLALRVPWRPIYQLLRELFEDPVPRTQGLVLPKMHGTGLGSYRHGTLFKMTAKLRRFFGPEAVAEVWAEVQGGIQDAGDASARFEALGWLALLLPTHDVCECDSAMLQRMLDCWMDSWGSTACSHQWDSLWTGLVCRLAKHDQKGLINWAPFQSRLFTHIIGLLEVPVGTSSGASPITGSPLPRSFVLKFMPLVLHAQSLSGCTIVHMLKSTQDRPHTALSSASALANLQHLVCLLEQYYHPSNTGKWSRELTKVLKQLVQAFCKQLAHQGLTPDPSQAALQPETQRAFLEAVLKLVARAQFSKDASLSLTACSALGQLAYISPGAVLPLVMSRFKSALETATATHQLAAAISSLAYCVRPLLLSGWPGPEAEESGPQMLAEALMALLPGIDANDEAKTDAVLHLYTAVLSSVPRLGEPEEGEHEPVQGGVQPLQLPLYAEEWSDELVGRLLALLENLDTGPGGHRGTDQGGGAEGGAASGASAFLDKHGGLLGHLFGQLLHKLPRAQGAALVQRLCRWVASTSLPSVESEVAMLVAEATSYFPAVVMEHLIRPLVGRVAADLPDAATVAAAAVGGHPPLSFSQEASLKCWMHVLSDALANSPGRKLLPMQAALTELVDRAMLVPLAGVQHAGGVLLMALCRSSCHPYAWLNGPLGLPPLGPNGVEAWLDKEGVGWAVPVWEAPSAEMAAATEALVQRYLLGACAALERLCAAGDGGAEGFGGHAHKTRLTAELTKIWGALGGFSSSLREFEIREGGGGAAAAALHPVGDTGTVGAPGVREAVAASLAKACRALSGLHPDVVSSVISSATLLLLNGSLDHGRALLERETVRRVTALLSEPPVAARTPQLLPPRVAAAAAAPPPPQRRRLPRWLATARLQQASATRACHSAFRSWCTLSRPQLLHAEELPAPALALLHEVGLLALHRYRRVRHEAVPVVAGVAKRFGAVARMQLANVLAAIGDVAAPDWAAPGGAAAQEALLFGRLAQAAAGGSGAAGEGPGAAADAAPASGDADTDRDGRCRGACLLLSISLPLWRVVFRDVGYFAGALAATLASRSYNTTPVQADIGNLVVLMLGRFMIPPAWEPEAGAAAQLSGLLLPLAKPGAVKATWRYTMLANVLTLLVMPSAGSKAVLPFVRHLLDLISSCEDLGLRQLALAGIYFNASCLVEHIPGDCTGSGPLVDEVRAWLGQGANLQALVRHLVSDHTLLDASEETKGKRGGDLLALLQGQAGNRSFEDSISRVVKNSVGRLNTWPDQELPAIEEGLFAVGHARVVQLLCRLAPQQVLGGLRLQVQGMVVMEKLQASSTSEKAEQATCAELVAGLLAAAPSAAPGAEGAGGSGGGGGGDSLAWVLEVLEQAMTGTTLELSESWAVAARFSINRLLEARLPPRPTTGSLHQTPSPWALTPAQADPALAGLLGLLTQLPGSAAAACAAAGDVAPAAAAAAAQLPPRVKLLRYLLQAVRELGASARRPLQELPPAVIAFWSAVYEEAVQLLSSDSLSLRDLAGPLLAECLASLPPSTSSAAADGAADAPAAAAGAGVGASSSSSSSSPMDVEAGADSPGLRLQRQAQAMQLALVQRFAAAAEAVQSLRPAAAAAAAAAEADGTAASEAAGSGEQVAAELLSALGVGLQVVRGLQHVEPGRLRGSLLQMLPHLFRLQELAGPVLQKLASESQLALVLLKYLPLEPCHVGPVLSALQAAVSSPLWSSRAAGLLFTQYFWFRQCFLLDGQHLKVLKEAVLSCLSDPRPDVRSISSATLAGMIKGLAPKEAEELRQAVLRQARQLLPKAKAAAATATEGSADLLKKHAAVLGLKAFLMSSPYDSPAWMPEVLLALVPWAGSKQPAAVRSEASLALSEFKRTHEQDSLAALKATMSTDDWDSLQAVTSSASYFA